MSDIIEQNNSTQVDHEYGASERLGHPGGDDFGFILLH